MKYFLIPTLLLLVAGVLAWAGIDSGPGVSSGTPSLTGTSQSFNALTATNVTVYGLLDMNFNTITNVDEYFGTNMVLYGNLTVSGTANLTATNSTYLGGTIAASWALDSELTTATGLLYAASALLGTNSFLGIAATAADSQLLDAIDSTGFYRITGDTLEGTMNGGGQTLNNLSRLDVTNAYVHGILTLAPTGAVGIIMGAGTWISGDGGSEGLNIGADGTGNFSRGIGVNGGSGSFSQDSMAANNADFRFLNLAANGNIWIATGGDTTGGDINHGRESDGTRPAKSHQFWGGVATPWQIASMTTNTIDLRIWNQDAVNIKTNASGATIGTYFTITNGLNTSADILAVWGKGTKYFNVTGEGDVTQGDGGEYKLDDDNAVSLNATANGMADDKYNGITMRGLNAGENITQWEAVYFDTTDSEYKQADANAAGEFPARGIAIAAGSDGAELVIITKGVIRNDGWAWGTIGGTIYLSETVGGLTQTAPTDAGDCVQVMGYAISDDEMVVNVNGYWMEL